MDNIVEVLRKRMQDSALKGLANDNVSELYVDDTEREYHKREVQRRVDYLLEGLLIDVDVDHNTRGTAERVARMYLTEVFSGRYTEPPKLTTFPNAKGLDQLYATGPISVRSACSHHLVPIVGRCWIGVVPGERVIGLSKFNRIVDWFARRPQIQEELVVQVADYIEDQMKPLGLAVLIKATHMCMTWRGVEEDPAAAMTTSVLRGALRENSDARSEFFELVKAGV